MQFKGKTINKQPATDWPAIHKACIKHPAFTVEVREYSEKTEISLQQMKYLHAVVFPQIAEAGKVSLWQAEFDCKRFAGRQWLIKTVEGNHFVLSKTTLSVKQTNQWIDNIIDWAEQAYHILIPLPNPEWRKTKG